MDDTTEGSTPGRMSVDIIKDGKHLYEFDYSLPPK